MKHNYDRGCRPVQRETRQGPWYSSIRLYTTWTKTDTPTVRRLFKGIEPIHVTRELGYTIWPYTHIRVLRPLTLLPDENRMRSRTGEDNFTVLFLLPMIIRSKYVRVLLKTHKPKRRMTIQTRQWIENVKQSIFYWIITMRGKSRQPS